MYSLKKRKESTERLTGVTGRETGNSPFLVGAGPKRVSYTDQKLEEHWGPGGQPQGEWRPTFSGLLWL